MSPPAAASFLLAFDTSGALGSVAVARGADVLGRRFLMERGEHAAHLVPAIREVLAASGTEVRDVEGVIVGTGPGSFTGIRVAAATAKGLVHTLGVPLWPVSSLAAGAASAEVHAPLPPELEKPLPDEQRERVPLEELHPEDGVRPRYVLFDARSDRVYAGCYRLTDSGMETVIDPHPARIHEVLEEGAPPGTFFCGQGALRNAEALQAAGHPVLAPPAGFPTAEGLLRAHAALGERDPEPTPNLWEPDYLRAWKGTRFETEAARQG